MLLERQVYNASTLVYFPFLFESEAGNINKPLLTSEKCPFLNAQANEIPTKIDIQFSPLVLVLPHEAEVKIVLHAYSYVWL